MAAHRFAELLNEKIGTTVEATARSGGFIPCPMMLVPQAASAQVQWQQQLYQRAYLEARAVARPAITERLRIDLPN